MKKQGPIANAPHADLTFKILGLAMQVRDDLGPGHREEVYHNALAARLKNAVGFDDEPTLFVADELGNVIYQYKPDFVIEGKVIVEVKAHTYPLTPNEIAQVLDYFAASDHEVALLINFGRMRLEWKRLFPPEKIREHRALKKRQRADTGPTGDKV